MKPIVKYKASEPHHIVLGGSACVFPINHPNPHGMVSNTKQIYTSTVLSYDRSTGDFETLNTRYVKSNE